MDEQLLKKVRKGDQNALAELLYDNYEIVYKYLYKFTFDKSLSEDLVQETMVRAIVKIEFYDEKKSKFSTWLITIAQNIYVDYLRKKKVENRYMDQSEKVLEEKIEIGIYSDDDSINRILDALARLDDITRLPLLLKHYYGFSYEEIANKMSIPLGTVKSRIHNGLKVLRKELGYDGE
ncbi:RNA polymerase sigma factor SigY [Acetivibrio cellulolyticus]|uniref:RNA polymerase sigma factor SigY n=1 Tax=Acetivibrio cellulolyticus TaxID=35830 RepID=UPI0001E2EB76|nr:RNA polymerase sigma factor SigY [Acetivibrio cellulolyticus]